MAVIAIFGSARSTEGSSEFKNAEKLGAMLADNGFDIVTGGYQGLMLAASKGASSKGTKIIGVVSDYFTDRKPNEYITEVINTDSYIERLHKLIDVADDYIVLPGSSGTLLEFATVWSLKARGIIEGKEIISVGDQWNEVLQTISFYSENAYEESLHINTVDSIEQAFNILKEKYKK